MLRDHSREDMKLVQNSDGPQRHQCRPAGAASDTRRTDRARAGDGARAQGARGGLRGRAPRAGRDHRGVRARGPPAHVPAGALLRLRDGLGRALRRRRVARDRLRLAGVAAAHLRRPHGAGRDLPGAGAGRRLGQGPQHDCLGLVRSGRSHQARRGRISLFRPARLRQRHRFRKLADLLRHDRRKRRPRRTAFLPRAQERRRGDRRLAGHGAGRHRLQDLRGHRQVHSVASLPRRPGCRAPEPGRAPR